MGASGRFIADYPAISCDSAEYLQLRPLFIFLALVVVAGFPVCTTIALIVSHRRGLFVVAEHPRFARRFGVLYVARSFLACLFLSVQV